MVLLADRARIPSGRLGPCIAPSPWLVPLATAAALLLGGCADDEPAADPDRVVLNPPSDGAGHTHAPGEGDPVPVGDGTRAAAGGYRLTDVRLPRGTDGPGDLTFRIVDQDDEPVVDFTEQQTELLHLYVVRTDYAIYRHVHPTLGNDGSWTAPVDLDDPGDYRVIADFQPTGADEPVVLGDTVAVPGRWTPSRLDRGRRRRCGPGRGRRRGCRRRERSAAPRRHHARRRAGHARDLPRHVRPRLGVPDRWASLRPGRSSTCTRTASPRWPTTAPRLTFHTTFERAGDYRLFVQVRVDGLLHTVPVTATVEPPVEVRRER